MKFHHQNIILLVLLIIPNPLSNEENDWLVWNLKGEVKELRITGYQAKQINSDWVIDDTSSITVARFDSNGNQTQEIFNNFHEYDSTVYSYDEKGYADTMLTYDKAGRLLRIAVPDKHISPHRPAIQNVYDTTGQLIEKWEFLYEGFLIYRQTIRHVKEYRVEELALKRNKSGEIIDKMIVTNWEGSKDTLTDSIQYLEYDSEGNWLRRLDIHEPDPSARILERSIEYY